MADKNVLVTCNEIIECEGFGEDNQSAVEKAFESMRLQVKQNITSPIISISTDKVECLELKDESYDEAFLFVFFKRVRQKKQVRLKVYLTIKHLNLEGDKKC
jgi:hypothetical protein